MDYEQFFKDNEVNFEIVKLINEGLPYKEIALQYGVSKARIRDKYMKFLTKLYHLYYNALQNEGVSLPKIYDFWEFYESLPIMVAYLEKTYKEKLDLLRNGAPPIMLGRYKKIPSFRKLTEKQTINLEKKIVEAKDNGNKSYDEIAKKFRLTREKVMRMYDFYYHKKVMAALEIIKPIVNTDDFSVEEYVYKHSYKSYLRWKLIVSEYSALISELLD